MKNDDILCWEKMNQADPVPECEEAYEKYRLYKEVLEILVPWTLDPNVHTPSLCRGIHLCFEIYEKCLRNNEQYRDYFDKISALRSDQWWFFLEQGKKLFFSYYREILLDKYITSAEWVAKIFSKAEQSALNAFSCKEANKEDLFDFYFFMARMMYHNTNRVELAIKSNFLQDNEEKILALEQAKADWNNGPVFFPVPQSFESARNNGERFRWLLQKATSFLPEKEPLAEMLLAQIQCELYGMKSLLFKDDDNNNDFDDDNNDDLDKDDVNEWFDNEPFVNLAMKVREQDRIKYFTPPLSEKEAIGIFNNVIRRFELPDDQNFILRYRRLIQTASDEDRYDACLLLSREYFDRQQDDEAVELLKIAAKIESSKNIKRHKKVFNKDAQMYYHAVAGNYCAFLPYRSTCIGKVEDLKLIYRNGKQIRISIKEVKIDLFLAEFKRTLDEKEKNRRLNRYPKSKCWDSRVWNWRNIGETILRYSSIRRRCLSKTIKKWTVELGQKEKYIDHILSVPLDLKDAGIYLVEAKMQNGNIDRILVSIQNIAFIIKMYLDNVYWFLVDARTGVPIINTKVHLTFIDKKFLAKKSPCVSNDIPKGLFSEDLKTDENGIISFNKYEYHRKYECFITRDYDILLEIENKSVAKQINQSFFYMSPYWNHSTFYIKKERAWFMTDRPIYRPGDTIHFKFLLAVQDFKFLPDHQIYAEKEIMLNITDKQHKNLLKKTITLDKQGTFEDSFTTDSSTAQGEILFNLRKKTKNIFDEIHIVSLGEFRVSLEEYRNPEYKIKIRGGTLDGSDLRTVANRHFQSTVSLEYFFGQPVMGAKITGYIECHKTAFYTEMSDRWDFLYEQGKSSSLINTQLVNRSDLHNAQFLHRFLDEISFNGVTDENGQYFIDWDLSEHLTSFLDSDLEFTINIDTENSSRRIQSKTECLIHLRKPFLIHCLPDRGFYEKHDSIRVTFHIEADDLSFVLPEGTVRIYRMLENEMKNNDDSTSSKDIYFGKIVFDTEGNAFCSFVLEEAGQYCVVGEWFDRFGNKESGKTILFVRGSLNKKFYPNNTLPIEAAMNFILVPEKAQYKPGEKARIGVFTKHEGMCVLLFIHSEKDEKRQSLIHQVRPIGTNTVFELELNENDLPNLLVSAFAVWNGFFYKEDTLLIIPPRQGILHIDAFPDKNNYLPGGLITVQIRVTDFNGQPVQGNIVAAVYDASVDLLDDQIDMTPIEEYFLCCPRLYNERFDHTLCQLEHPLDFSKKKTMTSLGDLIEIYSINPDKLNNFLFFNDKVIRPCFEICEEDTCSREEGNSHNIGKELPEKPHESETKIAPHFPQSYTRKNFADTALWIGNLRTDTDGRAEISCKLPDALTTWKIRIWGYTEAICVGETTCEIVTQKNIILRMQKPRFLTQKDIVILSANVHNYFDTEKTIKVSLEIVKKDDREKLVFASENKEQTIIVPPGGEVRVDWKMIAKSFGIIPIRMSAFTAEDSDIVEQSILIVIHGVSKTEAFSGQIDARSCRDDSSEFASTRFIMNVPEKRILDTTRLTIRFSPSLTASVVEAIPYLTNYPYKCSEQTLHRFLPLLIFRSLLKDSGIDPDAVGKSRRNLDSQHPTILEDEVKDNNPVFDKELTNRIVKESLDHLKEMECPTGGWDWFGGKYREFSPYFTALVVRGLALAKRLGIESADAMIQNGVNRLKFYLRRQIQMLRNHKTWKHQMKEASADSQSQKKSLKEIKSEDRKVMPDNLDVMIYWALIETEVLPSCDKTSINESKPKIEDDLLQMRNEILDHLADVSFYSNALFALALCRENESRQVRYKIDNFDVDESNRINENKEIVKLVVRILRQFVTQDEENQTASLDIQKTPCGWFRWLWFGDNIETQAAFLRLLIKLNPGDPLAPKLAKYLLNNRKNGGYWYSTRDTAFCLETFAEFIRTANELTEENDVEIFVDGTLQKKTKIMPSNLFSLDNELTMTGTDVESGDHEIILRHTAKGTLYCNVFLQYFSLEDFIDKAGLEIKIERQYRFVDGDDIQILENFQTIRHGDLIEVELTIESKNDCECVLIEDRKPAGLEPINSHSGYSLENPGCYIEYKNEKVCFFVSRLYRGTRKLRYKLRAEQPGQFSALPTTIEAMYTPELAGNSEEFKMRINDQ